MAVQEDKYDSIEFRRALRFDKHERMSLESGDARDRDEIVD